MRGAGGPRSCTTLNANRKARGVQPTSPEGLIHHQDNSQGELQQCVRRNMGKMGVLTNNGLTLPTQGTLSR